MSQIIGTYFYPEEMKTYATVEGDLTVAEGISCETGKRGKYMIFESEITPETFVEFSDVVDEKYGLICVKKAESKATHITMYEPEFETGFLPEEDANDGEYERRNVACGQLRDGREYRLPLSDSNAVIKVNDPLEIGEDGKLDKADEDNGVIALEEKSANEGGEIFVHLTVPYIPVASP